MKRLMSVCLVLCFCVMLYACGESSTNKGGNGGGATVTTPIEGDNSTLIGTYKITGLVNTPDPRGWVPSEEFLTDGKVVISETGMDVNANFDLTGAGLMYISKFVPGYDRINKRNNIIFSVNRGTVQARHARDFFTMTLEKVSDDMQVLADVPNDTSKSPITATTNSTFQGTYNVVSGTAVYNSQNCSLSNRFPSFVSIERDMTHPQYPEGYVTYGYNIDLLCSDGTGTGNPQSISANTGSTGSSGASPSGTVEYTFIDSNRISFKITSTSFNLDIVLEKKYDAIKIFNLWNSYWG